MFRMWCKLFDDRGHLIKDTVIKNADSDLKQNPQNIRCYS